MAWRRRFRSAYNRAYFSRYSPIRSRRYGRGRMSATFNPMFLVGAAVGLGVGDQYIPTIVKTGISLYGVIPVGFRGFGMVKHFSRGYVAGMVIRGVTGFNLGGVLGGGSSGSSPWV